LFGYFDHPKANFGMETLSLRMLLYIGFAQKLPPVQKKRSGEFTSGKVLGLIPARKANNPPSFDFHMIAGDRRSSHSTTALVTLE